jgi:hypothetical protein
MTRSASRDYETPERRKATLYCWECDHASPIGGDWVRSSTGESVTYVCPDCDTAIAERPRRDGERERGRRPTAAWSRVVRTSVSTWRAGFDAGLAAIAATVPTTDRGRGR